MPGASAYWIRYLLYRWSRTTAALRFAAPEKTNNALPRRRGCAQSYRTPVLRVKDTAEAFVWRETHGAISVQKLKEHRMKWTRPRANDRTSKAANRAEAEAQIAAFLAKGGTIKEGPASVPTTFSCANCGHTGIIGLVPGKKGRCPKCREPLQAAPSD